MVSKTCRLLAAVFACAFFLAGCSDQSPRQLYEKSGGFSYDPPAGWQIMEYPGLKYQIAHGPINSDFTPNINVVDETFSGSLVDYVEANLQALERIFPGLEVLSSEKVQTEDNQDAVMIIAENKQQGRWLRQTFFFIGPADRKYVVTCTVPAEGGDAFDPVFSECLKTFRLH